MAGGLFAKLSLIIHGRLLFESSSPILTLCIRVHTRVNRAETRLHRLTLYFLPDSRESKSSRYQVSYLLLHFSNDIGNYYHSH
ncbi:hypothetical protein DRW71_17430 [Salmonella enterica subsp. diarizonae]|nr:hypothetical protein [Salmonella enterica]EBV2374094.1 hypothetical protein [Salmonella enterica subsp. enterica serovar Enteritidis]ECC9191490.1 hypothetical protein [Salmonella enterica subsp. diarizonae]EBE1334984.1 hypothetical protein [Salmonella enterica]EBI1317168.1 hypothetical protein [Salmonella enterica]